MTLEELQSEFPHRFSERVRSDGDCLVWTGALTEKGYGSYWAEGRTWRAHRYAYYVTHPGALAAVPALVMHTCDNPPCVNPAHLAPGTDAANIADRDSKGRQARGSRHGNARLTETQVGQIRNLMDAGLTHRVIAGRFGVSVSTIKHISAGNTWAEPGATEGRYTWEQPT